MSELLLFSGGLDSTCLAAWHRPEHLLFVDYGQAAAQGERVATKQISDLLGLTLHTVEINLTPIGAGILADAAPSPHGRHPEFWPFRNQLLATIGAAYALRVDATRVLAGSILTDDRHVDGSQPFYEALDAVTALQEGSIRVAAPAIGMTAEELVAAANPSDEILSWTHSCHTGSAACGTCAGCVKRWHVLHTTGRLQA